MIPKDKEEKILKTLREQLGDIDLLQVNHFGMLQVGFNGKGAQTPLHFILQDMEADPENWHISLVAEYKKRLGIAEGFVKEGNVVPEAERAKQDLPGHAKVVGFIGRVK